MSKAKSRRSLKSAGYLGYTKERISCGNPTWGSCYYMDASLQLLLGYSWISATHDERVADGGRIQMLAHV